MGVLCSSKESKISLWPQWLAAFHMYMITIMSGATAGLLSPLLANLLSSNSPFKATKEQTTWVASLISLSRPVGSITGTAISIKMGSRLAIYISAVYFILGWITLICANSIEVVYVMLLCNGLGMGTISSTLPVYIGEIANPKIRGGLMAFASDGIAMGILLGNIMGKFLDPWAVGAINVIPTLLYLLSFAFFPDTPYYLIRCDKKDEAAKSIEWYSRGIDSSAEVERLSKNMLDSPSLSFSQGVHQLNTPVNRRALLKINIIDSFLQFSGIYTILEYMQVLFIKAQVTIVTPSSLVIIISIISILAGWLAMYTSDKFNRKTLIPCACITISLACITWGLRYQLLDLGFENPNLQWMVILAVIAYRVSIVMNLLPIITTITIEMFAPNIRHVGTCICCINSAFCSFITSKYFQYLLDNLTYKNVFYLISALILVLAIFVQIYLPETKGKTLEDIQAMLHNDAKLNESKKVEYEAYSTQSEIYRKNSNAL